MPDKERVKIMTKLAVFEQRENRMVFRVNSYMKNDYVTLNVIYTLFSTTLAFLLICAVVIASRYNHVMENLHSVNIMKTAFIVIGSWLVFELVFGVIAYLFYTYRYKKCKRKINDYVKNLKKLDELYETEKA